MSASACMAYLGLRFPVLFDQIDQLEGRTDPRQVAAKSVGLTTYWGNVGGEEERYILFVGARLAVLGPEGVPAASLSADELSALIAETKERLRAAGLEGEPALHLEWIIDT